MWIDTSNLLHVKGKVFRYKADDAKDDATALRKVAEWLESMQSEGHTLTVVGLFLGEVVDEDDVSEPYTKITVIYEADSEGDE